MYTASTTSPSVGATSWFRKTESWLDERGRAAWIAAMVLGFIFVWPVGLAFLGYMIWSKRMFNRSSSCANRRSEHRMGRHWGSAMRPSGNAAFDAYKADMMRRLEDEQSAFEAFMQRLREAKDKSEFDQFMQDRARAASETSVAAPEEGRGGTY
ncbi:MAG: DUF2852 domain-containing protein [Cypionkella sp.]